MSGIKIPARKDISEYEFRQNVPLLDYSSNAAFWSYSIAWMVIETCIALEKARLEKTITGLIIKKTEPIIPYEWETYDILVGNISQAEEAFWYCFAKLRKIIDEQDSMISSNNSIVLENPALSCSAIVQLAVYESECDYSKILEKTEKYLGNIDSFSQTLLDKAITLNLFIPCRFAEKIRELGIDFTLPWCIQRTRRP